MRSLRWPPVHAWRLRQHCLMPLFDAYTFGFGRALEPVVQAKHEDEVFLPQGWISAAVLVDGCIRGVWTHEIRRGRVHVRVRMFSRPAASLKRFIDAGAERPGAFPDAGVTLAFEEAAVGSPRASGAPA